VNESGDSWCWHEPDQIPAFGGADQAADRGLPFGQVLLSLRQLHHVVGGILESDELATAGQRDRIIEGYYPALGSHHANSSGPAGVNFT